MRSSLTLALSPGDSGSLVGMRVHNGSDWRRQSLSDVEGFKDIFKAPAGSLSIFHLALTEELEDGLLVVIKASNSSDDWR
jgi:hypothetical protein